MTVFFMYREKK